MDPPTSNVASTTTDSATATMIIPRIPQASATDSSVMKQIILDDFTFSHELQEDLRKWGDFLSLGFDYSTIAVLGCQSSGKSTLLNLLFDTKFPEMDAKQGRKQTTKGLWMSRCANVPSLVLDVEGTDSRERGSEHKNFERKSALFSLAVSEVLLVNMWASDVGRWEGSNFSLLQTVFELHLQLFGAPNSPKTLLLFVLRDHTGETSLEQLSNDLKVDLAKMWDELDNKPEEFKRSNMSDFFDLEFVSLPHKTTQKSEFDAAVLRLRRDLFETTDGASCVFRTQYKKHIPADGFYAYASQVWETIMSNRDVDIPSQKEMLAHVRCGELSDSAYRVFSEEFLASVSATASTGVAVERFGERASEAMLKALEAYDGPARRYHERTRVLKRADLMALLNRDVHDLLVKQVARLSRETLETFDGALRQVVPSASGSGRSSADACAAVFGSVVADATHAGLESFDAAAQALAPSLATRTSTGLEVVASGADEAIAAVRDDLSGQMNKQSAERRADLMDKVVQQVLERRHVALVRDAVSVPIEDALPSMWSSIRAARATATATTAAVLDTCAQGLATSKQEMAEWTETMHSLTHDTVVETIRDAVKGLSSRMVRRFDAAFKYDSAGVPRSWQPNENIREFFIEAKKEGSAVLELFIHAQLSDDNTRGDDTEDDDDNSNGNGAASSGNGTVLVSDSERRTVLKQFEAEIELSFQQAIDTQRRNSAISGIPPLFYLILLVLGWDEIFYLLTSPIAAIGYLVGLVVFVGAGYTAFLYFGFPVDFPGLGTATNSIRGLFHSVLRLQAVLPAPPVRQASATTETPNKPKLD